MAKIKVKFELQGLKGLKVEVEADREDFPMVAKNLGSMAGFIEPSRVLEGVVPDNGHATQNLPLAGSGETPSAARRKTRTPRRSSPTSTTAEKGGSANGPVVWSHSAEMWGTAQQKWSGTKKAMWLLYVISRQSDVRQLSASRLSTTFNKHYKQAGLLRPNNLARDLGKLKVTTPAPVGEDTNKTPSEWFLTQQGEKEATALVNEALGRDASGQTT